MRRRALIVLAAVCAVIFIGGIAAAWFSRNDTICADGKAPTGQFNIGLGQTQYRCENGETVTK